jgi:Transcriptional regulator
MKGCGILEIKHIIFFNTVCKYKSFSKAANELFFTQQAVSKKIKELEEELNTQLFIRSSLGVELTKEGIFFLEQSSEILKKHNEITEYFRKISNNNKNSIKIGISHGIKILLQKGIFQEFEKMYSEIRLELNEMSNEDVENSVQNKNIDIGLTINPDVFPNIGNISLFHEPIYCIVNKNHHFASRDSLTFEEILNENIVMIDKSCKSYYNFMKQCSLYEKNPKVITVPDIMSIYESCFHDNIVGFSLKKLSNLVKFDGIVSIPLQDTNAYWDVCLIWNKENKNIGKFKYLSDFILKNTNIEKRLEIV